MNTLVTQAWIVDETGEKRAGEAFLRGSQAGQAGGLIAIPISIALGSVTVRLPILLGGGLMILLAAFLAVTMTEEGSICAISEKQLEFEVTGGLRRTHTWEDFAILVRSVSGAVGYL